MTAGTRQKMIVLTLVVVIAVLAVTGVSLAVWISGDGEFIVDGEPQILHPGKLNLTQ